MLATSALAAAFLNGVVVRNHLKPRVAIAFLGHPKLGGLPVLREVQQFRGASEIQQHAHLPGLRHLDHLEAEQAISGVTAHHGDKDDAC